MLWGTGRPVSDAAGRLALKPPDRQRNETVKPVQAAYKSVILSERSESKDLRKESLLSSAIVRRSFDSVLRTPLRMTYFFCTPFMERFLLSNSDSPR